MSANTFNGASQQQVSQEIIFPPERPLFCRAALAGDKTWHFTDINNLIHWLEVGSNESGSSNEFAIESVLRNLGRDPNSEKAWEDTGFTRDQAIAIIEQRYKQHAQAYLSFSPSDEYSPFKHMAYIMTPSNLDKYAPGVEEPTSYPEFEDYRRNRPDNFLRIAVSFMRRAHVMGSPDGSALLEDKTWQDIGFEGGLKGVQNKIRELYASKRAAGYMLAAAGHTAAYPSPDVAQKILEASADYYFRDQFPQGADKLGIPSKAELKQTLDNLHPARLVLGAQPSEAALG